MKETKLKLKEEIPQYLSRDLTDINIERSVNYKLGDEKKTSLNLTQLREVVELYPRIYSDFEFIANQVVSVDWQIRSGIESDEANEMQNYITTMLENMDTPIETVFRDILESILYGYTISEIIWEEGNEGNLVLSKIKKKDRNNFVFRVDEFGNLKELIYGIDDKRKIIINDLNKLLISVYPHPYSDAGWKGNPITTKMYPIYKRWKSNLYNLLQAIEFSYIPIIKAYGDDRLLKSRDSSLEDLMKKISLLRAKREIVIPADLADDKLLPIADFTLIETQKASSSFDAFFKQWEMYDRQIDRIFGIPSELLDSNEVGSYAKASVQHNQFNNVIQSFHKYIAQIINKQLIRQIIEYSKYYDENMQENIMPYLTFNYGIDYNKAKAEYFDINIKNGLLSVSDDEDNAYLREMLGFPEKKKYRRK